MATREEAMAKLNTALEAARAAQRVSPSGKSKGTAALAELPSDPAPMMRASSVEGLLDRVFLSPRLVDQRAYDELGTTLKALVRDAASSGRTLANSAVEAKALSEGVRESIAALDSKIDTAARMLPTIDARSAKVEQLVDRMSTEVAGKLAEARAVIDGAVHIDREKIDALVRGVLAESVGRAVAEAVEAHLPQLRDAVQAEVRREWATAQNELNTLIAKVSELTTKLNSSVEEGEVRLGELQNRIDTQRARIDEASGAAEDAAVAAEVRVGSLLERLAVTSERIESNQKRLDEGTESAEVRLAAIANRLEQRLSTEAGTRVADAVVRTQRAEADLLAAADLMERKTAEIQGNMNQVVERVSVSQSELEKSARQTGVALSAAVAAIENRVKNLDTGFEATVNARVEEARTTMERLSEANAENAAQRISAAATKAAVEVGRVITDAQSRLEALGSLARKLEGGGSVRELLALGEIVEEARRTLPEARATVDDARALHSKIEEAAIMTDRVVTDLNGVKSQAEQARIELGETVLAGAEWIDRIEERLEQLKKQGERDLPRG